MLDEGNSFNIFSLEVISSLLSVRLRKILGLSYSSQSSGKGKKWKPAYQA